MAVDVADVGDEGVEVRELGAVVVCAFSEEVLEAAEVLLCSLDLVGRVEDALPPADGAEEFADFNNDVFAVLAWDG